MSLAGHLFLDRNGDAQHGADEPGLAGATVTLYNAAGTAPVIQDADGEQLFPVVTGMEGRYRFGNLIPGAYTLGVTVPPGYVSTGVDPKLAAASVGPVIVRSPFLAVGVEFNGLDAGFVPVGTPFSGVTTTEPDRSAPSTTLPESLALIVDSSTAPSSTVPVAGTLKLRVWMDGDRDGRVGSGEVAVAGVGLRVLGPDGKARNVTTDDGGVSSLVLPPGTYQVRVTTLPAGVGISRPLRTVAVVAGRARTLAVAGRAVKVAPPPGAQSRGEAAVPLLIPLLASAGALVAVALVVRIRRRRQFVY